MNKKGLLANIITGFMTILIGLSLLPVIANQIEMAVNCNNTSNLTIQNDPYYGQTDSFGGGGTEHFGGYDGQVVHKSFLAKADFITGNSNSSIVGCIFQDGTESSKFSVLILQSVPTLFALAILIISISIAFRALRDSTGGI